MAAKEQEVTEKEAAELKKENGELLKAFSEMEGRLAGLAEENARYSEAYERLKAYIMPDWMRQELDGFVQKRLEGVEREIIDAADGMANAIGDDVSKADQEAEEEAKRYRRSRAEQTKLNRIQNFLKRCAGGGTE